MSIIVAEYIPFGANQVVQMNNNLGSTERVQGGFFTAMIDEDSSGTKHAPPAPPKAMRARSAQPTRIATQIAWLQP